jgi:phosphoribosylamine--glycine ligase
VIALCDGERAVALPAARDHKRLLDGDRGPNTGGMGAYSPLADLPPAAVADIVERFHRPVLRELARRGTPFRGALYAGLMLTDDGPRLLEFNARFGDPETQVVLPRLAVALGPLLLAAARGRLPDAPGPGDAPMPSLPTASVGIVLAAEGYPDQPRRGDAIAGIDVARDADALVFHAGTRRDADGTWRTNGGRILTVVGRGAGLEAAAEAAQRAAGHISWTGLQRRHDIGVVPEGAAA